MALRGSEQSSRLPRLETLTAEELADKVNTLLLAFMSEEMVIAREVQTGLNHMYDALELLRLNRIEIRLDTEDELEHICLNPQQFLEEHNVTPATIPFIACFIEETNRFSVFSVETDQEVYSLQLDEVPLFSVHDALSLMYRSLENQGMNPTSAELRREELDQIKDMFKSRMSQSLLKKRPRPSISRQSPKKPKTE